MKGKKIITIAGAGFAGAVFFGFALADATLGQLMVAGLTNGSIYALIAVGFTIIYNSTDIVNFAQGEFAMAGALVACAAAGPLGLPLWAAVFLGVAAGAGLAALFEFATFHQLKSPSAINMIIITIGASILFKGIAMFLSKKDDLMLAHFSGTTPIKIGQAALNPQYLWIIGATALSVVALHAFYTRTVTGKALRACAHNPKASSLMGINVKRMILITFALSGAIGALAGIVITPVYIANYLMGKYIGLKGFSAAILGGMGSIYGAVAGGLAIGVMEALFAGYVNSGYKDAFAFVIMLLVLFVRPQGIMGETQGERA